MVGWQIGWCDDRLVLLFVSSGCKSDRYLERDQGAETWGRLDMLVGVEEVVVGWVTQALMPQ